MPYRHKFFPPGSQDSAIAGSRKGSRGAPGFEREGGGDAPEGTSVVGDESSRSGSGHSAQWNLGAQKKTRAGRGRRPARDATGRGS